jgi:hypothetical protein
MSYTFLCLIFANVSVDIRNWVTVSLTKQTRKTRETNQRKYKEISILLNLEEPSYAGETNYSQNLHWKQLIAM